MVILSRLKLKIQCWNVHGAFFNLDGGCYSKLHHDAEIKLTHKQISTIRSY